MYSKIKSIQSSINKLYSNLANSVPWVLIIIYFIFVLSTSILGIVINFRLNPQTQELFDLRNSKAKNDANELSHIFQVNQSTHHFQHQLLDIGYYVEFIAKAKNADNIINSSILLEYDYLFDKVVNLSISRNGSSFSYASQLCAKRLGRCAIEGGLVRNPIFKDKLLKHKINYDEFDPRSVYMDAELNDGTNIDFLFGKIRNESFCALNDLPGYFGRSVCIKGTQLIRNRFDLLYETDEEKTNSIEWMFAFADMMSSLEFKYLDVTYYTSHTIQSEIEKYSAYDIKFVALSVIALIVSLSIILLLSRGRLITNIFIPLIVLVKIICTIASTIGIASILSIQFNFLLVTIVIAVILISFIQMCVLMSNLSFNMHCTIRVLIENYLMPNLFSTISIIGVYLACSIFSSMDAIRIFSLYTAILAFTNLIGQLLLVYPMLVYYMRFNRPKYEHQMSMQSTQFDSLAGRPQLQTQQTQETNISLSTDDISQRTYQTSTPQSIETTSKSRIYFNWFRFLHKTSLKYVICVIFILYFMLNSYLSLKLQVNLPLLDLLPKQSYLYKHMLSHRDDFSLGPIVMFSYKQPFNYLDKDFLGRQNGLIQHIKGLNGMNHKFELNWQLFGNIDASFYSCKSIYENQECFSKLAKEQKKLDFNLNDINYEVDMNKTNSFNLTSSRFYLQYATFDGTQQELDTYEHIQYIARYKYGFNETFLSIYSIVSTYFEQMSELRFEILYILIFTIEIATFLGFFFTINMKTLYLNTLIQTSLLVSCVSWLNILKINLNFLSLIHFLLIPMLQLEIFSYLSHLYIKKLAKTQSKLASIKFLYRSCVTKLSLLLCLCLVSIFFMNFCVILNFTILFQLLVIYLFNSILHLYIFYPILLNLFGPNYIQIKPDQVPSKRQGNI